MIKSVSSLCSLFYLVSAEYLFSPLFQLLQIVIRNHQRALSCPEIDIRFIGAVKIAAAGVAEAVFFRHGIQIVRLFPVVSRIPAFQAFNADAAAVLQPLLP